MIFHFCSDMATFTYKYCTMYFYCLAMFCLNNTARFSISTVVALVIFNFFFAGFVYQISFVRTAVHFHFTLSWPSSCGKGMRMRMRMRMRRAFNIPLSLLLSLSLSHCHFALIPPTRPKWTSGHRRICYCWTLKGGKLRRRKITRLKKQDLKMVLAGQEKDNQLALYSGLEPLT